MSSSNQEMNPPPTNTTTNTNALLPPYLLFNPSTSPSLFNPRYHQHLNHLNDVAFTHTKMLQEIIEKRTIQTESLAVASPHGSISSASSSSHSPTAVTSSPTDLSAQRKRLDSNNNNVKIEQHEIPLTSMKRSRSEQETGSMEENLLMKRRRKQSKPQQVVIPDENENSKTDDEDDEEPRSPHSEPIDADDDDDEEEEEMGEVNTRHKNQPIEKQAIPKDMLPMPPLPPPPLPTMIPFGSGSLPFFSYIQDLARANNINSPLAMARFLENLQKELFSAVHNAALETKRVPPPPPPPPPPPAKPSLPMPSLPPPIRPVSQGLPPLFSQTVHHHHHPYFSQILFNNSFVNHFPSPPPSLLRFAGNNPPPVIVPDDRHHHPFPFHLSTPKKRRTKVTDTRLSPRVAAKVHHHHHHHQHTANNGSNIKFESDVHHHSSGYFENGFDDLTEDDKSSSNLSSDPTNVDGESTGNDDPSSNHHSLQQQQPTVDYNGFQVTVLTSLHLRKAKLMFFYTRYPSSSVLKVFFPDVRFNKLITAQLVKWFSNFREFFYIQIEKYARQYLAEGIRNVDDLIISQDSDLYRVLNLHYNRSNQIDVPISFGDVVQATLKEFFHAIQQQKDLEPSWKKSIYKVIQRLDDQIPDFFKDERWMHSI